MIGEHQYEILDYVATKFHEELGVFKLLVITMTRLAGLLCWMIQWCLTDSTLATTAIIIIITAFILSRLDYCNAVLAGLPKVTFVPLQQAQNAVMRLILCLAPHDHVTSALRVIQK